MNRKAQCTCKVVVLLIKLVFFSTFSLPPASLDLKVPIAGFQCHAIQLDQNKIKTVQ